MPKSRMKKFAETNQLVLWLGANANRVLALNILTQAGIMFSGAVVRVSGSGLGCPTWPQCTPGSFIPTPHQAQSWHKFVEYGNRTLTGLLVVVALGALIAAYKTSSMPLVRTLAWFPIGGTFVQAFIGGVTVLTNLHSGVVVVHFLVSVALVAASAALWFFVRLPSNSNVSSAYEGPRAWLSSLTIFSGLLVMTLGSIVSGSGPHSGDSKVSASIPVDPRYAAWLHADAVWLFLGVIAAGWLFQKMNAMDGETHSWLKRLTVIAFAQGLLGYTQFFSGLPVLLVAIHVALAASFWTITVIYSLHLRYRAS